MMKLNIFFQIEKQNFSFWKRSKNNKVVFCLFKFKLSVPLFNKN